MDYFEVLGYLMRTFKFEAARRPEGTTVMEHERPLEGGLGGRRQRARSRRGQPAASQKGMHLDSAETAGSHNTAATRRVGTLQDFRLTCALDPRY
jgi:hypothetical protein